MKRILSALLLAIAAPTAAIHAQSVEPATETASTASTIRVYADMTISSTSIFGFNEHYLVSLDLGQRQNNLKSSRLVGDDGKAIKFDSRIAALNYMGERGWRLAETFTEQNAVDNTVRHWLLYKDVTSADEAAEGLRISNAQ